MVRFKVVRASRLFLILSIVLLAAVLCLLAFHLFGSGMETDVNTTANLVMDKEDDGTKADLAFAPSESSAQIGRQGAPIEIRVLPLSTRAAERPSILIYHTHTHEAYEQVSDDPYDALEAWRTTDADHSVVRVGDELARLLEDFGFEVTHDATDHEGSDLSTAYTRSLQTLQNYRRRFDLYIDLHRDAWTEDDDPTIITSNGEKAAHLMVLIGNGEGFEEKPYYSQNLAFARALEERINEAEPGLCKPVLVKDGRYNQHVGVFSILVEVGHNRNTLQEALNALPSLANGLYSLMIEHPDTALLQMKERYEKGE